jgi:CBS domain containing-hemolysin-like protein
MGLWTILAEYPGHLAAMALLLGASAFFSLSETALFNLSRDQLRRFRVARSPLRQLAARLMEDPRRLLVTVLFGNMTVNTAFFVLGVSIIADIAHNRPEHAVVSEIIIGFLTPVLVIIFGEIVPKSVAAAMPERLAPLAGLPLVAMGYAVEPIRAVLVSLLVTPLTRLVTLSRRQPHSFVTKDELQALVEIAAREGSVTTQESDMLADVLELGDLKVREVMMPRVEIVGCDRVTPMAVVLAVFRRTRHTKMVVYEDEMDNIVGVVYAKTAFLSPDRPLTELVQPVYYVPEMKTVEGLLKDFRARKIQFAVVVDEYGGVAGIVTLEDCLEQIVGRIEDETDRPAAEPVQRAGDTEYVLAGNLSIRSWADAFDLDVPAEGGRYATVAGFVTSLLGRLPRPGDTVEWRNLAFVVEEVRRHRVTRVRLRLLEDNPEPSGVSSAGPGQEGGS